MFQTDKIIDLINHFKKKPYAVPILIAVIGIILLTLFSGEKKQNNSHTTVTDDPQEYVKQLEEKLEKSIGGFGSVESCDIMITLSSYERNEYLENSTVSSSNGDNSEQYDRKKEYLVIDREGNDSVIIENRNTPEIKGVLIVYKGNGDVNTKKDILDAAATVLGIKSNKVCVVAY